MIRLFRFSLCLFLLLSPPCRAKESLSFSDRVSGILSDVKSTFTDPETYDLYVPYFTWHTRSMYDWEKTRRFNEFPAGAGFGLSRTDANGNEDRVFLMVFKDSNRYFQTAFGYEWHKTLLGEKDGFHLNAGISLTFLQRHEYHYLPAPLPLPIIAAGYGPVSVEATYIPWKYNDGNIFFSWVRVKF